jgi:hypothetical protein
MAHLNRPLIVTDLDATEKKRRKGIPIAKKVDRRPRMWYAASQTGYRTRRVSLASDKAVARRKIEDSVRMAEQGHAGVPDRGATDVPLTEYLAACKAEHALGLVARAPR